MAETPNVMPHLHMPLQSGSDRVLRGMRRSYRSERFLAILDRVRALIPDAAITTDIIVGFPGETEADFEATLDVVRRLQYSKLHVFRYSARPGTAAAERTDEIDSQVKKERSKRLIDLGNEIRRRHLEDHLGRPLQVLVEDERVVDGVSVCSGQTDDYVRVWFEGCGLLGRMATVDAYEVRADGLKARLRRS